MNGLTTPIRPVDRSEKYRSGIFGAAFVMIFMVLTYFAMIVGSFWFLWNVLFLGLNWGVCGILISGILFVIGLSLFIALIKPLFARQDTEYQQMILNPKQEPALFAFVSRICEVVGAPKPNQIMVDPQVNAAASFVSGVMDQRLRLVIGLPLVLGLDTRQFAGVLAHEFGHFSQSRGMRLTFIVRSIDMWFQRAVTQRDFFDRKLDDLASVDNLLIRAPFWFAGVLIWLARGVLIGLIYAGHFFSSRLLQEMEFDADRHETRLAGGRVFANTCERISVLSLCQSVTFSDLDHYRRMKRLPDNLPAILVDNQRRLDEDKVRELQHEILNAKTNWYDSHPSDRDRIENAAREQTEGIFAVEHPSSVLFSDIDGLCKVVTMQTYQNIFGKDFDPSKINKTDDLIAEREVTQQEGEAAIRFIMEQFSGYDSFLLPRFELGQPLKSTEYKSETQKRREQLIANLRTYASIKQQEDQVWDDIASTTCTLRLMEAGFNLERASEKIPIRTERAARLKLKQLKAHDENLKARLTAYRQYLGVRLIDALEFLRSEKVATSCGEPPDVANEIRQILKVWNSVVQLRATFETFFFEARVNSLLLRLVSVHIDRRVHRSLVAALSRLTTAMIKIEGGTKHLAYPFKHGSGNISVAKYLVPELPKEQNIEATLNAAMDLDSNLEFLLRRCISRLGALAEKVEKAFGFEPLEIPDDLKQKNQD